MYLGRATGYLLAGRRWDKPQSGLALSDTLGNILISIRPLRPSKIKHLVIINAETWHIKIHLGEPCTRAQFSERQLL